MTLIVTLRQPTQIGLGASSDNTLRSHDHIPGSVVRGALAAAWIAANGQPQSGPPARTRFAALFEGGVRYGPLFSDGPPMPLSVQTHKYDHGETCQVIDHDESTGTTAPPRCAECGSPLVQARGLRAKPVKSRRTNVAIHASGVAARGLVVTRESMPAGTVLRGALVGSPDDLAELAALERVWFGGRRTTHGLASIAVEPGDQPPALTHRDDGRVVLRLASPGVFVDDDGRPRLSPNERELAEHLETECRLEQSWARWTTVGGWHAASGLPKPTELAAEAGSTYVIRPVAEVPASTLARLGARGLGLRRHEGFGDLADAPRLAKGARERRADHEQAMQGVKALRRRRGADDWPRIVTRVRALIGDSREESATRLSRMAQSQNDAQVAEAVAALLAVSGPALSAVVEEIAQW